ncbi:MAG TPA: hypothetical protein VEA80_13790 [Vitreimonas sp.]|uniref:hypothetical protein n=1 Tax=Vitreimonas sp. TaxID=3069702 RepID=UPI002D5E172B|nr:hypothetical protein [Vitreimonas sp.]HYD88542.1 hypothetical protein [Vitreimonas sp.]
MFFAETLGPALTPASAAAMYDYVLSKTKGRRTVSAAELHDAVAEFLRYRANNSSPDAAVAFLKKLGRIAQDGTAYKLTA